MPEPLIESRAMVGEWDGEGRGWTARDWVPGPAGTVGLSLPGGVELEVDVAAPGTFVGLWVDAARARQPSLEALATLAALVGEERATALLSLRRGGVRPLPSTRYDRFDEDRVLQLDRGTDPTEPGLAPALARHALAAGDAVDHSASDLVVALSLLDAAAAGLGIDGLDLERRAQDMARRGADLLADVWSPDVSIDLRSLRAVVRELDPLFTDDHRRAMRAIVDGRDQRHPAGSGRVADAAMPASAPLQATEMRRSAPVSRLRPVDVSTLPESLDVLEAAARNTRDAEAEVRIPGRPDLVDRVWARTFDADGVIVAAAPLLDDGGDAVARLLVPPSLLAGASFDVTDRPDEARPSRGLRATVDAIAHGRSAARAERLRDRKETYARWGRSAESWGVAGDDDRAQTARRYATDGDRGGRIPPALLADPVVEAGG
ncbi:hypothetical protein [Actinospongicola halichondriae]|uniref:hypothetical protein n=1 Tax=Actinospongicola halichondriae TaxID=3236844 RepID=UPI003D4454AD